MNRRLLTAGARTCPPCSLGLDNPRRRAQRGPGRQHALPAAAALRPFSRACFSPLGWGQPTQRPGPLAARTSPSGCHHLALAQLGDVGTGCTQPRSGRNVHLSGLGRRRGPVSVLWPVVIHLRPCPAGSQGPPSAFLPAHPGGGIPGKAVWSAPRSGLGRACGSGDVGLGLRPPWAQRAGHRTVLT